MSSIGYVAPPGGRSITVPGRRNMSAMGGTRSNPDAMVDYMPAGGMPMVGGGGGAGVGPGAELPPTKSTVAVGPTGSPPVSGGAPQISTPWGPQDGPPTRDTMGTFDNFSEGLSGQVRGYGDMLGQDLKKNVGGMLANLNRLGALRSGAVETGLNDMMTTYGRNVGDYASMTAGHALDASQREGDAASSNYFTNRGMTDAEQNQNFTEGLATRGQDFRESEARRDQGNIQAERDYRGKADKRKRKSGLLGAIGGLVGGGIGFLAGGPAGALAGASVGSRAGG